MPETSRTRRIIGASRRPSGIIGLLLLGVLLAVAAYVLVPQHWPLAKRSLLLLLVAVAAGFCAGILRLLYRLMHQMLPQMWRRVMGGFGSILAALGYCGMGAVLAWLWQEDKMEAFLAAATFTVVFLVSAFRAGYSLPPR